VKLRTESKRGLTILDEPSVTQRYPAMLPEALFSLGLIYQSNRYSHIKSFGSLHNVASRVQHPSAHIHAFLRAHPPISSFRLRLGCSGSRSSGPVAAFVYGFGPVPHPVLLRPGLSRSSPLSRESPAQPGRPNPPHTHTHLHHVCFTGAQRHFLHLYSTASLLLPHRAMSSPDLPCRQNVST
jgi:hypothetical protein